MIVQAISLLDDLDKEVNTYAMRVKEWYGWHFPELVRIVTDNLVYARLVLHLGLRKNVEKIDLSDVLEEVTADIVKKAAQTSMGTDISEDDISHVKELCTQVIEICEYREELYEYIKNRMRAIAPNLTVLVGELVGARLIAHAGSLMNLAKHPASTVQILGAEKALFRALKTKKATPKYGLIYHASLVGQSQPKSKGKVSRILANKAALSIRVDALGDQNTKQIGVEALEQISNRIQELDGRRPVVTKPEGAKIEKYEKPKDGKGGYNPADDVVMKDADDEEDGKSKKKDKKEKKDKKKDKKRKREEEEDSEEPKKKKKKKEESSSSD
jgi:nucleolar protein 58